MEAYGLILLLAILAAPKSMRASQCEELPFFAIAPRLGKRSLITNGYSLAMAYPVSRPRVRAPLSLSAASSAAGASCACDDAGEAARAAPASSGRHAGALMLLAPWLAAGLIALLLYLA